MCRSLLGVLFLGALTVNCFAQDADQQQIRNAALLQKAQAALARGHKPSEIRDFEPTVREAKIRAAFDDETSQTFVETPLEEACKRISKTHNIPILIDRRALEEIGLTPDTPVNVWVEKVKLRSAIRLMLRELDLTYLVADEFLQITTIEAAERNLATKMLKLDQTLLAEKDDLIKVIQKNIVPDAWESSGGPASMMYLGDILIISATDDVIHQAEVIIGKLTALRKKQAK